MLLLFLGILSSTASDASFVFVRKREIWLVSIAPPQSLLFLLVFNTAERSKKRNKNRRSQLEIIKFHHIFIDTITV